MGFKKRGISAVVAVVLMVVLVVVGAGIVFKGIVPVVEGIDESFSEERSEVSIIINKGYTVYDPVKRFAFVQIKRGSDSENVSRLRIIFRVEGESVPFETSYAPMPNQEITYSFNFSATGIEGQPDIVSVAPIFNVDGGEKMGEITSSVDMPIKPATVSSSASAKSSDNTYVGDEIIPESLTQIHLTECGFLDVENGDYVLDEDISTSGTCFTIMANGITLDGNNFEVSGDGDSEDDYGITTPADSGLIDITIKNFGNIKNFGRGIYLDKVNDSLISGNTMISSMAQETYAIYLQDGDSNRVENNVIEWNVTNGASVYGIFLYVGLDNSFQDNYIIGNNLTINSVGRAYGIYLWNHGLSFNSNTIQSNVLDVNSGNDAYGIYLYSYQYLMKLNTIQSNVLDIFGSKYAYGVYLKGYGDSSNMSVNTIQSNTFNVNAIEWDAYGVFLENGGTSDSNTIQSNTFDVDAGYNARGIVLFNLDDFSMSLNTIQSNTLDVDSANSAIGVALANAYNRLGFLNSNKIQSNNFTNAGLNVVGVAITNSAGTAESNIINSNNGCGYSLSCLGVVSVSGNDNQFSSSTCSDVISSVC